MSKVRMFSLMVGAALILCTAGPAAQAAAKPHFTLNTLRQTSSRAVGHKGHQLHATAAPQSLTQNTDPNTITNGISVSCNAGGITTANTWMRRFDLDGAYGITGNFTVSSLDFGVELLTGATPLHVQMWCYNAATAGFIDLTLLNSSGDPGVDFAGTDGSLYFQNTSVGGTCNGSTDDLVVEVTGADCQGGACQNFFIGANSAGQSGPGYIGAADCGIVNPTDLALIGFPSDHIVMTVNGDDGGGSGGTPAIGPLGVMALVLILLGTSAFFLRRQVVG